MTTLDLHREERQFNCEDYLNKKIHNINDYLVKYGIEGIVLGVSGGIDSTLTYKILERVKDLGQLKLIIPTNIGFIHNESGVTNQADNQRLCNRLFLENKDYKRILVEKPISVTELISTGTNGTLSDKEKALWVNGQANYMFRTPYFYQIASIYQAKGFKTIVCGTTNKSEGSYIGFFGKFSDMAVDIQVISDLYKSQVFELSEYLGVDNEVINRTPSGDVLYNLTDEELMGVTYDELELFLHERESNPNIKSSDSSVDLKAFNQIEALHVENKHKYFGGYQAVFIINDNIKIKGGWNLKKFDIKNY